jgi:uridine kinase
VVGTDEFWDGSGFALGRLRAEVFEPLLAGVPATYASWDWARRRSGPPRTIEPVGVVVVEGVCALHRMFRDDYDVRVWVEAPYEVRLARGVARDGEAARKTWVEHWMPSEDRYIARDDPVSCADVVIDGSRPG